MIANAIYLLVRSDLLHIGKVASTDVGLHGAHGGGAALGDVSQESASKRTPGVKLALQALHVHEEIHDVLVGEVTPGCSSRNNSLACTLSRLML